MQENTEEYSSTGLPLYGDFRKPQIGDPSITLESHHWWGANDATTKLVRCVEAVRDLAAALRGIVAAKEECLDKRAWKVTATPLYNFAESIHDLYLDITSKVPPYVGKDKRKFLSSEMKRFLAVVPIGRDGALKTIRDRLAAHLDKKAINSKDIWALVEPRKLCSWIRAAISHLLSLLDLDIYGWSRNEGCEDTWALLTREPFLVHFQMKDGDPELILSTTMVESPKNGVVTEVERLVAVHNKIALRLNNVEPIILRMRQRKPESTPIPIPPE